VYFSALVLVICLLGLHLVTGMEAELDTSLLLWELVTKAVTVRNTVTVSILVIIWGLLSEHALALIAIAEARILLNRII